MSEHTPTPWAYRPNKHDDWGWIRGPVMEGEDIGELVARAHCWKTHEEADAHRVAKTDPYEANAAFIVKAVNSHEPMDKLLAEAADYLNSHSGMDGMDLGYKITEFRRRMQADLIAPRHT